MESLLQDAGAPGASVTIIRDGVVILDEGLGYSDPAGTALMPVEAGFYIYSITKTVLATVMLRLCEQGRIAIDDAVAEQLPDAPVDSRITIRQLLNHTAGLPDYSTLPEYFAAVRATPSQPWSRDEFLERSLAQGALSEPGEGWQYSNIGYLLVKNVIEQVTQMSLREAVGAYIVEPLGLRRTHVAEFLADAAWLTPGWSTFFGGDDGAIDATRVYHPGWVSHGVIVSTARETALLLDALATGKLVRPESLASMLEPVVLPFEHALFRTPAYGLGVMIDAGSADGTVFGHGGGGPGYSLGALHFTSIAGRRVTSVAFVNSEAGDVSLEMAFRIAEAVAALEG